FVWAIVNPAHWKPSGTKPSIGDVEFLTLKQKIIFPHCPQSIIIAFHTLPLVFFRYFCDPEFD
ncbi:Hypothetical predicted protein, partial [Olea europaea subsp. europaea]